jgi:hypothetical protein
LSIEIVGCGLRISRRIGPDRGRGANVSPI